MHISRLADDAPWPFFFMEPRRDADASLLLEVAHLFSVPRRYGEGPLSRQWLQGMVDRFLEGDGDLIVQLPDGAEGTRGPYIASLRVYPFISEELVGDQIENIPLPLFQPVKRSYWSGSIHTGVPDQELADDATQARDAFAWIDRLVRKLDVPFAACGDLREAAIAGGTPSTRFWGSNYFGPRRVDEIGRDKFKGEEVESVDNGGLWLHLTDRPFNSEHIDEDLREKWTKRLGFHMPDGP